MSKYKVTEVKVVVEAEEEEVMVKVLVAEVVDTTQVKEDLRKNKRKLRPIKNELMLLKKNKRQKQQLEQQRRKKFPVSSQEKP